MRVSPAEAEGPIAVMCKRHKSTLYMFAVNLTPNTARASFKLTTPAESRAEVLHEDRSIALMAQQFEDSFEGYAVHCYRFSK